MPDKSVFNLQQIGISLLAGLAAAAVGAVAIRGGFGGLLFAHVAPLPIVIIALGFGITHAASTALLATVILSIWPHPIVGMGYALLVALPAFIGAYAASGAPRGGRDLLTKNISSWAALAPAAMLSIAAIFWIIVASIQFGSLDEALSTVQGRAYLLFQMMQKEHMIDEKANLSELSGAFARSVPGFIASYGLFIHVMNLWIGGRIAQASGLLSRPWPDIARDYYLPRAVAALFACGLALIFFSGPSAAIGVVLLATMGLLLALQGFAVVHEFLRALNLSALLLSAVYLFAGAMTVWQGWPIAFFAAVGVSDMFFDYRNRKLPGLNKTRPPAPMSGSEEKPD